MASTDYGHALFLLMVCWKHPHRRCVAVDSHGRNICSNCAVEEDEK
jgi:hypothetical protein